MSAPGLSAIRECFDGGFPALIATCAEDGTPNVSVLSDVRYIDDGHVALSYQFFTKTRRNVLANPEAMLHVTDPGTGARYLLEATYLRTESSGPLFEAMKAKLAGIASHEGMARVFRLRGADVYAVRAVSCVVGGGERRPTRPGLLLGLRACLPAIRAAGSLAELIDATLDGLTVHLRFAHCMILLAEGPRLFTVGSRGYPDSGVGSEVALGEGVIGVAARERIPIRITHMAPEYLYGAVVREQFMAANPTLDLERRIPFPGLADSRSQLALPVVSADRLVGVIYVESPRDGGINHEDEDACAVLGDAFAGVWAELGERERLAADEPADDATDAVAADGAAITVSRDAVDSSVYVNGEYLIKGVAGAILWRMLSEYVAHRRRVFTNRELRRDPQIRLPEVADNLEARLVLLQRRLLERRPGVCLKKAGRGRYELVVGCPIVLADGARALPA